AAQDGEIKLARQRRGAGFFFRKITYFKGCSIFRARGAAVVGRRSARLFSVSRQTSPLAENRTFYFVSFYSPINGPSRDASTPCRNTIVCLSVLPEAFSGVL